MKLLRIAGLSLFLLAAISYTGYRVYEESIIDEVVPVITDGSDSIIASVNITNEDLLRGVVAKDDKDGDVTNSLMIEAVSDFVGPGERIITYAAFDSNNNIAKQERKLVYTDYIPPRFSLSKPLRLSVGDQDHILDYLKVWDCIDGDLSDKIKFDEPDYSFGTTVDTYQIEFQVTNSAGDTAYLPTEVEFYNAAYSDNKNSPEILLKEYLIYIKKGEGFDPKSYLKGSSIGNQNIVVSSNVNKNKPGVYNVEYSMMSQNGYSGTTKLVVVVEE